MELRDENGGAFSDSDDFEKVCSRTGSKVNKKVRESLGKVGAFASWDALPANHPDRRKDQKELMGGLTLDVVKADRQTDASEPFLRAKIIHLIQEYKACKECHLSTSPHPVPRMKATIKFVVILDGPSWEDEKEGALLSGVQGGYIKAAIKGAGLQVAHGYYTALVKAKKESKSYANESLNACSRFLQRELEILKPAVIVALGSNTVRFFLPDKKPTELLGQAVYVPRYDATVVCGIHPGMLFHDPAKASILEEVFATVAEILS
jgi:DNA polymerase-3 subunit alpha